MKSKKMLISLAVLFLVSISANLFAAGFAETYGISTEGIARGNAMCATVNDWSSVYYNIGGLGKSKNITGMAAGGEGEMTLKLRKTEDLQVAGAEEVYPNEVAFALHYAFPQLNLSIQRYGTTAGGSFYPLRTEASNKMHPYGYLTTGVVVDMNVLFKLPDFVSSGRIGLGLGMNFDLSPFKLNLMKLHDVDPRTHNFINYGNEVKGPLIMLGGGMGFLNDAFGGGIGVKIGLAGKGNILAETQLTGDAQIPIVQATMDMTVTPVAIAGIYISPGKLFSALEGLDLAASYRMETKIKISPFNEAAVLLGGVINMDLRAAVQDYYAPHALTGGIAYSRWGVTLSADVELAWWNKYMGTKITRYNYIGIQKYKWTWTPKVGVKYDTPLSWLSVMIGYSYIPSYLKKNSGSVWGVRGGPVSTTVEYGMYNELDNNKHVGSLGLKFTIPKMWRFNTQTSITVAYQLQYLVPKSVQKYGMRFDDGVAANMLEAYLLNPSYRYGGMNHLASLEIAMRL